MMNVSFAANTLLNLSSLVSEEGEVISYKERERERELVLYSSVVMI